MTRRAVDLALWLVLFASLVTNGAWAKSDPLESDAVRSVLERGRELAGEGEQASALPFYRHALDLVEAEVDDGSQGLGLLLHEYALVLRDAGETERAERFFRRSLDMLEELLGLLHPDVAGPLGALAEIDMMAGRYAEAEARTERVLGLHRVAERHGEIVVCHRRLAKIAEYRGADDVAMEHWRQAAEHAERWRLPKAELAEAVESYGALLCKTRPEDGESTLRRALGIQVRAFHGRHPLVARTSQRLAACLERRGKVAEARSLVQQATDIAGGLCGNADETRAEITSFCADLEALATRLAQAGPAAGAAPPPPEASAAAPRTQPAAAPPRSATPRAAPPRSVPPAAPPSAADPPRATPPPVTGGPVYRAQLASRSSRADAEREIERMQDRFAQILAIHPPHLETADLGARGLWHRVQFGRFESRADAVALCDALRAAGAQDCIPARTAP